MHFEYKEKDSEFGKDFYVSHLIAARELERESDYEDYAIEDSLIKLGLAFAKKYAGKRTMWQYIDKRSGKMEYFTKPQDKPYLELFGKEIQFILKAVNQ